MLCNVWILVQLFEKCRKIVNKLFYYASQDIQCRGKFSWVIRAFFTVKFWVGGKRTLQDKECPVLVKVWKKLVSRKTDRNGRRVPCFTRRLRNSGGKQGRKQGNENRNLKSVTSVYPQRKFCDLRRYSVKWRGAPEKLRDFYFRKSPPSGGSRILISLPVFSGGQTHLTERLEGQETNYSKIKAGNRNPRLGCPIKSDGLGIIHHFYIIVCDDYFIGSFGSGVVKAFPASKLSVKH